MKYYKGNFGFPLITIQFHFLAVCYESHAGLMTHRDWSAKPKPKSGLYYLSFYSYKWNACCCYFMPQKKNSRVSQPEERTCSAVCWYSSRFFCIFCQLDEQTVAGVVVDSQHPLGSVQTPCLTDDTDAQKMATNNVLFRAFPSHSNV